MVQDGDGSAPKVFTFLKSITVARVGVKRELYAFEWSMSEARDKLALKEIPHTHTFVEYLSCLGSDRSMGEARPGKLYLDYDHLTGTEQPSDQAIGAAVAEVSIKVQIIVDRLKHPGSNLSFKLATRHGWCPKHSQYKISIRPFILGLMVRYTDIPDLIRWFGQEDFWDLSVYKPSEQLLASINGCKGGFGPSRDTRVLSPENPTDDPLDYVVQHVESSWMFLDLPAGFKDEKRNKVTGVWGLEVKEDSGDSADPRQPGPRGRIDPDFVHDLVLCLPLAASDDRQRWIRIGMALKDTGGGCDDFYPDFQAFSRRSGKWDGEYTCRKTWNGFKSAACRGCTFGTVCFEAQLGDPLGYRRASAARHQRELAIACPSGVWLQEEKGQGGEIVQLQIDPHGPLRSCLVGMDPIFKGVTRERFSTKCIENGSRVRLEDPTLAGVVEWVFPSSVRVNSVVVGDFAPDLQIEDMSRVLAEVQDQTRFSLSYQPDKDGILLTDCDDNLSRLVLRNINNKPMGSVDLRKLKTKNMTAKQAKAVVESVKAQVFAHIDRSLGTTSGTSKNYFNITLNQTINNLIVVAGEGGQTAGRDGEAKQPSDFSIIRSKLEAAGTAEGLRKANTSIYEPIPGCPCAFVKRSDYAKFINVQLKGNEIFKDNPRRFRELMAFLVDYEMDEIPDFTPDRDLLSFSNGVLQLASGVFTLYEGLDPKGELAQRVARHHIPKPYHGCADTPLLDTILHAQFEEDVAELLFALIGRSLFKVGQRDGWQVMLFLVGVGGTGKSLVLEVVTALFVTGSVGNLAAKREEVFGMANLIDKEIVVGRDMPAKMSACLSQETMQGMTAGEGMETARKGTTAVNQPWTAPLIMASNHMPDYVNTGNNVGRRIVSIRFDNVVTSPQDDLLDRILDTELPNIVFRALTAYTTYIARVKSAGGGLWKNVPAIVVEWQGRLKASTNKVESFFAMDDEARGYSITFAEGSVTWLEDLKAVFAITMKDLDKPAVKLVVENDLSSFNSRGFHSTGIWTNVCLFCKQRAAAGCCPQWTRDKSGRGKKQVVLNMRMQPFLAPEVDTEI